MIILDGSAIVGRVKDTSGATVKGATVTIIDSDKKVAVRTVTTNDDGEFSVPLLPAALYDVTVEATGFKKHIDERVKLNVNERRSVDVALEAESLTPRREGVPEVFKPKSEVAT